MLMPGTGWPRALARFVIMQEGYYVTYIFHRNCTHTTINHQ